MNNIEILEHKLKLNEKTKFDWFGEKEFKAIENLIQENKELKNKCNELNFKYTAQWVDDNFIPKSKILNFINNELPDEEICECCSNYDVNGVHIKNELKKLLEEGE